MDPEKKKKEQAPAQRKPLEGENEQLPVMAPPAFSPTAAPVNQQGATGTPPLNLQLPQMQLNPPTFGSDIDPDLMRRMALVQRLRNRTPLLGGLLSEEHILKLWHTPSDSTYDWDNGESGRTWDLYGPEQMDEQMQIGQLLNEHYPEQPGWSWGVNGNGLGGTYNFNGGSTLDLGVMPHSPEDLSQEFPWMEKDEDAPMVDGATFGMTYRW